MCLFLGRTSKNRNAPSKSNANRKSLIHLLTMHMRTNTWGFESKTNHWVRQKQLGHNHDPSYLHSNASSVHVFMKGSAKIGRTTQIRTGKIGWNNLGSTSITRKKAAKTTTATNLIDVTHWQVLMIGIKRHTLVYLRLTSVGCVPRHRVIGSLCAKLLTQVLSDYVFFHSGINVRRGEHSPINKNLISVIIRSAKIVDEHWSNNDGDLL